MLEGTLASVASEVVAVSWVVVASAMVMVEVTKGIVGMLVLEVGMERLVVVTTVGIVAGREVGSLVVADKIVMVMVSSFVVALELVFVSDVVVVVVNMVVMVMSFATEVEVHVLSPEVYSLQHYGFNQLGC